LGGNKCWKEKGEGEKYEYVEVFIYMCGNRIMKPTKNCLKRGGGEKRAHKE
jgi:hypothetical protein